jgi:hypothetical protein
MRDARHRVLSFLTAAAVAGMLAGCDGGSFDPASGLFQPAKSAAASASRKARAGADAGDRDREADPASADPSALDPDRPRVITLGERAGARAPTYSGTSSAPSNAASPDPDPYAFSQSYAPPAPDTSGPPDSRPQLPADPNARTPATSTTTRPAISAVSPSTGSVRGGNEVLITGSDFANAQVLFGAQLARVTSQSSNAVTVIAPDGEPGAVPVVVTNREGTYSVAASAYLYR